MLLPAMQCCCLGPATLLLALQCCLQCCCRPCNAAAGHAMLLPAMQCCRLGPATLLPAVQCCCLGPCDAAASPAMLPAAMLLPVLRHGFLRGFRCCLGLATLLPALQGCCLGPAMLLPGPRNAATVPGPASCNRAWVFDPDIESDHVTRSCYSIMLLIHVTRSCYSFLLLDPVTHSCYSIRSVLIDSPQQSNPLYDRSHFRPCRFNRQVHASIYIYMARCINRLSNKRGISSRSLSKGMLLDRFCCSSKGKKKEAYPPQ